MFRCIRCAARFASYFPLCSYCFSDHALVPIAERARAAIDGEVELTDARALARAVWQRVDVPAFPTIELRRGAFVVLVGSPGVGKSTMIARALDSIRGVVLLLSVEEPGGPSLALRLARLGVKREDLLVASRATVDQLASIVRDRKVVAIGIDSIQRSTLEPRDLRHLLLTLSTLSALFVASQTTKSGDIRGTEELRHEADVVLELDTCGWRLTKSRYQPTGLTGPVLSKEEPVAAE
jgi:hypothetical protein